MPLQVTLCPFLTQTPVKRLAVHPEPVSAGEICGAESGSKGPFQPHELIKFIFPKAVPHGESSFR